MNDDERFEGLPGLERFRGELRAAARRRREDSWLRRNRWRVVGASMLAAAGFAVSPIGPAYGLLGTDDSSRNGLSVAKNFAPVPDVIPTVVIATIEDAGRDKPLTLRVYCTRDDPEDKSSCQSAAGPSESDVQILKGQTERFSLDAPAKSVFVVLNDDNSTQITQKVQRLDAQPVPGSNRQEWTVRFDRVRRADDLQIGVEFARGDAPLFRGKQLFRAKLDAKRRIEGDSHSCAESRACLWTQDDFNGDAVRRNAEVVGAGPVKSNRRIFRSAKNRMEDRALRLFKYSSYDGSPKFVVCLDPRDETVHPNEFEIAILGRPGSRCS